MNLTNQGTSIWKHPSVRVGWGLSNLLYGKMSMSMAGKLD